MKLEQSYMSEKGSAEQLPGATTANDDDDSNPETTAAVNEGNSEKAQVNHESKDQNSTLVTSDTDTPSTPKKGEDENVNHSETVTDYFTIDDVVNKGGYGKFQKMLTFLAGLGWLADAFEIIILSIIGDFLACEWPMKRWQNAVMTSVVFLGMSMGAPVFGTLADRYGRRTALAISMLLLFIFGASSALAPNYTWMTVLRGLMGFSLGGIAQGVTLCCEYYPARVRGRAGFYLSYYWAVGALGVALTAWLIMKTLNSWRIFVFVASLPALVVFLVMKWYPESARYYLVSNQSSKALNVLKRLTEWNKSDMPKGRLIDVDAARQRGRILDLLKPALRRTTLLFWYIWWSVACTYYGIALITPIIITEGSLPALSRNKSFESEGDFTQYMDCKVYTDKNYVELLWTSAAEFPGLLMFTFLVEYTSRKFFLGMTCIIVGLLVLFLQLEMQPQIALLLVLFVARAIITGIFQLLFIMTTEAFPTTLRASAMGTGSGMARIGGIIIPYVAQVVVVNRPSIAIFSISVAIILAGIAAFLLPLETRGREMEEVVRV